MHLSPISVSIAEAVQKLHHQFDFILILRKNYLARKCSAAFKLLQRKNNSPQAKVTLNINAADFAEDDRTHREMLRLTEPCNPFFIDYERDLHQNTRKRNMRGHIISTRTTTTPCSTRSSRRGYSSTMKNRPGNRDSKSR